MKKDKSPGHKWPLPSVVDGHEIISYRVCIPNEPAYRRAFLAAVSEMAKWYNWDRDENRTAARVSEYLKQVILIEGGLGCNEMLRQKPGDPKILQQQGCDGQWSDLIDISASCGGGFDIYDDWELGEQLLDTAEQNYADAGENALLPQYLTLDASQADLALCNALEAFIKAMAQTVSEYLKAQVTALEQLADLVVDIADKVAIAAGVTGRPVLLIVVALVGAALKYAREHWDGLDGIIFDDPSVQTQVVCAMKSAMAGDFSRASFQVSLDNTGFAFGTFADIFARAMIPLLDDLDVYLAFITLMEKVSPLVVAGLLNTCVCGTACLYIQAPGTSRLINFSAEAGECWFKVINGTMEQFSICSAEQVDVLKGIRYNNDKGTRADLIIEELAPGTLIERVRMTTVTSVPSSHRQAYECRFFHSDGGQSIVRKDEFGTLCVQKTTELVNPFPLSPVVKLVFSNRVAGGAYSIPGLNEMRSVSIDTRSV